MKLQCSHLMPDTKPPLIRVATMAHFIDAVERAGMPVVELCESVGVTAEMLDDPRSLAPAQSIYRFTELAAKELKEPNLGVRLGLDREVLNWPVMAGALADSGVMAEFFARFLLLARKFTTSVEFSLDVRSGVTWFRMDRGFTPPLAPAQIDGWWVGVFTTMFQSAFGTDWRSSDLLFRVCDPEAVRIAEIGQCGLAKGNTRMFEYSFPTDWLTRPAHGQTKTKPESTAQKPLTEGLISAIRSNIRSNISDPDFGVPKLVAQMGFDRRKVQKFLRERGSGLSDLIEEERLNMARDLLGRGDHTLEDVAQALGYTDVSNFSRAFRRWTGVPPSRWKDSD